MFFIKKDNKRESLSDMRTGGSSEMNLMDKSDPPT
jgi:hypothetical protein